MVIFNNLKNYNKEKLLENLFLHTELNNMNIFSKIFRKEKLTDRAITINRQAIELNKKEQEIYKKTIMFENKSDLSCDYLFYDFQILCEFITKYKNDLQIEYDWNPAELLDYFSLALRFLQIGHYETCGIYIRKAFEYWTTNFCANKSRNNCRNRLERIIEQKKSDKWPMKFDSTEVYKIYKYLSNNFTHFQWNNIDINFDKQQYLELNSLFTITIITISNITINLIKPETLLKYRKNRIDNPVEEYLYYAEYIWPLVWSGMVSWCQHWFMNTLKYSWIKDFDFEKYGKWLDLNKWIKDLQNN